MNEPQVEDTSEDVENEEDYEFEYSENTIPEEMEGYGISESEFEYEDKEEIREMDLVATYFADDEAEIALEESSIVKIKRKPEMIRVLVPDKPCHIPKPKIIPRNLLSRKKHLELLAKPSFKCPPPNKREELRRLLPLTTRVYCLALPTRRQILATLEEYKDILPPEMLHNLIKLIDMETCLTPKQAESIVRNRDRRSIKKKRFRTKHKKFGKSKLKKKSSRDKDSVAFQLLLAQKFIKNILERKHKLPSEEYQDLAKVIFRRLVEPVNYKPTMYDDNECGQIRFLSEVAAGWILELLVETSEEQKEKLSKEVEKDEIKEGSVSDLITQSEKSSPSSSNTISSVSDIISVDVHENKFDDEEDRETLEKEKIVERERRKREKQQKKEEKRKLKEEKKAEKLKRKGESAKTNEELQLQRVKAKKEEDQEETIVPEIQLQKQLQHHLDQNFIETREPTTYLDKTDDNFAQVVEIVYALVQNTQKNDCSDSLTNQIEDILYCEILDTVNRFQLHSLSEETVRISDFCGRIAVWIKQIIDDSYGILDIEENQTLKLRQDWLLDVINTLEEWFGWMKCKISHYREISICKLSDREWEEWVDNFCQNYQQFNQLHINFLEDLNKFNFC